MPHPILIQRGGEDHEEVLDVFGVDLAEGTEAEGVGGADLAGVDGEAATAVAKGTQVTITATPNKNYRFNRWTGNIEQNPYTLTVTEDLDLEAEFESTL